MGLFDDLASTAMGMLSGSGESGNGLLGGIMGTLAPEGSGGVGGLVQFLKDKGLGDAVSSWVGTGENLPVSADQIQSALGNETIQNLASKLGVSTDDISTMVAQYLPGVVDSLTPDGKIPDIS